MNNLLLEELKRSFYYFVNEVNDDFNSLGYGLVKDNSLIEDVSSIASVGYGLAALVIGVNHKWISFDNAYKRALGTLNTFLNNVEGKNGFFYHFVDIKTGKRVWNSEVSIIDTGIFICGAITAGNFFNGDVYKVAQELYNRIDWPWYVKNNYFRMGYKPKKGFWGYWDSYAEQLMLYVLGCGSSTHPVDSSIYDNLKFSYGDYDQYKNIIYTHYGNLFTYQYSHAWIDFRNITDKNGIDWFNNSVKATLANRKYCIDMSYKYKTYGENSWGLSACISPRGYKRDGAFPCYPNVRLKNDGTIPLSGAIASIVFTPDYAIMAMNNYYKNPKLFGKYGFIDSFNLENGEWYSNSFTGINKGIGMVMIENYLNGTIWKYFMMDNNICRGLDILGFRKDI